MLSIELSGFRLRRVVGKVIPDELSLNSFKYSEFEELKVAELVNSDPSGALMMTLTGGFGAIIPTIIETKAKEKQPKRNPDIIPFTEQNLLFDQTHSFFSFSLSINS